MQGCAAQQPKVLFHKLINNDSVLASGTNWSRALTLSIISILKSISILQTDKPRGGQGRHKNKNIPADANKTPAKGGENTNTTAVAGAPHSEINKIGLSSPHEVVIDCFPKLKPSLIVEMKHVLLLGLPPVPPPVLLDMPVLFLAIPVLSFPRDDSHPKLVDAQILFHTILYVELADLPIQPVQLGLLVGVVLWLSAIVTEPG